MRERGTEKTRHPVTTLLLRVKVGVAKQISPREQRNRKREMEKHLPAADIVK